MFKGREKELYIILSLPSYYLFASQKKNMISFFGSLKLSVCDTQLTLFSFRGKFKLYNNTRKPLIQRLLRLHCYNL